MGRFSGGKVFPSGWKERTGRLHFAEAWGVDDTEPTALVALTCQVSNPIQSPVPPSNRYIFAEIGTRH